MPNAKPSVELMEEKAEMMTGGASPLGGMVDKSMLLTEDSNRWTVSEEQSNYGILLKLNHDLLVTWDNLLKPRHRPVKDQNGQWHEEYHIVDNFHLILEEIYQVRTDQNTLADHTRQQHLQLATVLSQFVAPQSEKSMTEQLGKFVGVKPS